MAFWVTAVVVGVPLAIVLYVASFFVVEPLLSSPFVPKWLVAVAEAFYYPIFWICDNVRIPIG